MKKINVDEQAFLIGILNKAKAELLKYPNVKRLGIGYALKEGKITDELALIVFVSKKLPIENLSPIEVIPNEIFGAKVDVIEFDPVLEQDPTTRFDPLQGGISISNYRSSGRGTMGGIFKDIASGKPVGLTNWHVVKNTFGTKNDSIVQPGWSQPTNHYVIGQLLNWSKANDCSIFSIDQRRIDNTNHINDIYGTLSSISMPLLGTVVQKSGLRTEVTYGIIQAISGNVISIVPNLNRPQRPDKEISLSGDSGSLWINDGNPLHVYGLHYAGHRSQYIAYAIRMLDVMKVMNIDIL